MISYPSGERKKTVSKTLVNDILEVAGRESSKTPLLS